MELDLGQELANRKCPTCHGGQRSDTLMEPDGPDSYGVHFAACPDCRGSGFWLQGVRKKCPNGHMSDGSCIYTTHHETNCRGLGFTVSTRLEDWLKAICELPVEELEQVISAVEAMFSRTNLPNDPAGPPESFRLLSWWLLEEKPLVNLQEALKAVKR